MAKAKSVKKCKFVAEKIASIRDNAKRSIENAEKCNEDVILCLKILPEFERYIWVDYEVNVSWPVKSFDEVKDVLKTFAKESVLLDKYFPSDTNPIWKLKGKNVSIRLNPSWAGETSGASCRLMKVGEKVVVEPVYKLICDGKELGEEITKYRGKEELVDAIFPKTGQV